MAITLSGVRFHYPEKPDKLILNIPSWHVDVGEHIFVHGESGGGKSTLLNVLSGLLSASHGSINILGSQLDTMTRRQRDRFRAQHIGYVFQQFNLIPYLNAVDNIHLANQFSHKKSKKILTDETEALLNGLNISDEHWQTPAEKLSIGQQQRVAIARALINKPKLLIADEPTSSLDPKNRDAFMSLLMSLLAEQNITLLFVSHDMSLSSHFARIEALRDINHLEERI